MVVSIVEKQSERILNNIAKTLNAELLPVEAVDGELQIIDDAASPLIE